MPYAARTRLLLTVTTLLILVAQSVPADDNLSSIYSLLPTNFSGSSRVLPGERRESWLSSERLLSLNSGFQWLTSTDLSRTRFDQPFPVRAQSLNLSTGPKIRLGNAELSLPFNAGRETSSLGSDATWTGSSPRMTLALGTNDKVRLEAKLSNRNDQLSTTRKRSASVSWLHNINDRWSVKAGLRQEREFDSTDNPLSTVAETYANIDARLAGGWRWSLASSLSGTSYGIPTSGDTTHRDRSASLALSTRYPLYGGWWISGELKARQTWGEAEPLWTDQSGALKLFRNF
jgi:hypothetical protein